MVLKLYNTLSRKKEVFKPIEGGKVKFYTCGPTVWNYAHIGNLRAYVAGDLLRRYLEYSGFKVKHVMNITDVNDKIIKRSLERGLGLMAFIERYTGYFFEDIERLNILKAHIYPRATEHIKEMAGLVDSLLRKGIAYKGKDGSVYYDISKFPGYGKLSHTSMKGLKAGARVSQDEYGKGEARDFALWKAWTPEDRKVFWTPLIGGEKLKGRPGWHIECSAMSVKYLGQPFDIHSGGVDLIFPHHENEIAQSEGATGKPFVRHWFHNEHLLVEGRKMSKSLGNFYTLRDLLKKGYGPRAIRYVLLATHYRQQLNFSEKALGQAQETIERLDDFAARLRAVRSGEKEKKAGRILERWEGKFKARMDDDLNVPEALSAVFGLVKEINIMISENRLGKKNAGNVLKTLEGFDSVLGLGFSEVRESWQPAGRAPQDVRKLIEERERLRKGRRWKEADRIRSGLAKRGILLEDTEEGPKWKRAGR